ncbi:MAG: hypothetical protein JST84_05530 [Acidobacteria bacterium]|nr:hypothetical protein [Acidobacteriota bacterium]
MPIKPENKKLYPPNWKTLSHLVRFVRAKGRCQNCGRTHGQRFLFSPGQIILRAAHLNQDPTDNRKTNLRALYQKCHLAHDCSDNLKRAAINRFLKRLFRQPTLFDFEERAPYDKINSTD